MFYQLRANLFFTDRDPINDIIEEIQHRWDKAQVVNPGTEAQECSEVEIVENHHDADPNEPCAELYHENNCPG